MVAGAPRTHTPPKDEMIALGKEMVEWVEKNDPLHLSQWYKGQKMIIYKDWKSFIQKEEFIPYYEQALNIIGVKYLDKRSNVKDNISQRWLRVYFADLRDQEDLDMDADAKRKKEIENNRPTQVIIDVNSNSLGSGIALNARVPAEKLPAPGDNSAE